MQGRKGRTGWNGGGGRQEGVAGAHSRGGRKKDEGDEEGEAEGRRPASRTKTQVHIQGDVGRCPGVTSIKDGLPLTAATAAPGRTYCVPSLGRAALRTPGRSSSCNAASLSRISQLGLAREDRTNRGRNLLVSMTLNGKIYSREYRISQ